MKTRKLKDYLEQERHSYPKIFEESPDILLFVIDLRGMIVKMRGKTKPLFGIEAEKIVGKQYRRFIFKEDIVKVNEYFTQVVSGDSSIC